MRASKLTCIDILMISSWVVTAIPLSLALKSTIAIKQKLVLSAVFSITFIITLFSIVRYAVNNPRATPAGPSWLQIWSSIEHSVSIAVASAASFRAFVVHQSHSSRDRASDERRKGSNSFIGSKMAKAGKPGFSRLASSGASLEPEERELDDLGNIPPNRSQT